MELRSIALRKGAHLEVDVYTGWGHAGVYTLGPADALGPGTSVLLSSAGHH